MQTKELFEAPENDLAAQVEARALANAFAKWIVPRNEDRELWAIKGVEMIHTRAATDRSLNYLVSGETMGLPPEYSDLMIGFSWTQANANAALKTGWRDGKPRYMVVINSHEDPGHKKDVAFGIRWSELIHELVHYLDRKRTNPEGKFDKHVGGKSYTAGASAEEYYNSPLEFNAYFQQGMHDILNHIQHANAGRRLADMDQIMRNYTNFRAAYISDFQAEFRHFMTDKTKRKFEKRLHGLYQFLKPRWKELQIG